jgi:aspartyl-tRNA(Asn)/glutamyl-tRNA(Gln) amidotransferase subunit A
MTAPPSTFPQVQSATDIAELVRSGELKARDVVRAALQRIERDDRAVNSFVVVNHDLALAAAQAIDARVADGFDPGPLAGVPIGIKDNEAVAGLPTRFGSLLHADAAPEQTDSEHVARLRAAGAVPIGKVAMGEFGLDAITHTLAHGTTRNPWNLERTPGGSSGGSAAAVSAGMVPICTGSDALGSIRVPAAYTGLVGLKPSLGRIPRAHGFRDTAAIGPLTRTVADAARYLDIVSGPSNRDRATLPAPGISYERAIESLDVRGLRAIWSADLGFAPVDPEVISLCETAFERLVSAAKLTTVARECQLINVYPEWNTLAALELRGDFERAGFLPEHIERVSPVPRAFIQSIQTLSLAEQSECRARIRTLEQQVAAVFERTDLLLTPTACCAAYDAEGPLPTVICGKDASKTNAEPFTVLGSICWLPSITVPAGVTSSGLPVGLLINGPRHRDEVVLRLARIWERSSPWTAIAPNFRRAAQTA